MGRPREYDEPRTQTSIRLPRELHAAAVRRARDVGGSLSKVVEVALREHLRRFEDGTAGDSDGRPWDWR